VIGITEDRFFECSDRDILVGVVIGGFESDTRTRKGVLMEIPGKVSLYCPLIDAKGTAAKLVAISQNGYYHVEVAVKGNTHTMFLPIAHAALYFSEPEPIRDEAFEIEP
jgi:hypothetical protein